MQFNLFGKKAELEVRTDRTTYRPGEAIAVQIRVRGEDELRIEEGRAELISSNRYTYRDEDRDTDGDRRVRRVTTTAATVVAVDRFLDAGTVQAGATAEHTLTLALPAGVPPSGEGEITAVAWTVRAALNVKRAGDPDAEIPITVLAPAAAHADRATQPPHSDAALAADLAFDLPNRSLRPGATLEGTFHVTPHDEIDAQEVRVELVRREDVRRGEGLTEETVVGRAAFGGDARLSPDQPRQFPFALALPPDACPTLQTEYTTLRWLVRGVINRRLRADHTLSQELHVFNAD